MKNVISSSLLLLLISTSTFGQVNKQYKKANYPEVISALGSDENRLSVQQTLKLAHSYYEMKSFYRAKILYYQVLKENELNDFHTLALADILLSTGMLDLSEDMLTACKDKSDIKHQILTQKIAWARKNQVSPMETTLTKMENQKIESSAHYSKYFNSVINTVQIDRKSNSNLTELKNASIPFTEVVKRTTSNDQASYVRNSIYSQRENSFFAVKNSNINQYMKSNKTEFDKLKKHQANRLWIVESKVRQSGELQETYLSFCNDASNYVSPYLSNDRLYFSSDRPGGFGGYDLYYVTFNEASGWGTPVNLGPKVNSAGNEMYPTIVDNQLCFSSDGLPGFGGADIFTAKIEATGFGAPLNLGVGVNSGYDELSFVKNNMNDYYFVSNRDNIKGLDEVYKLEIDDTKLVVSIP